MVPFSQLLQRAIHSAIAKYIQNRVAYVDVKFSTSINYLRQRSRCNTNWGAKITNFSQLAFRFILAVTMHYDSHLVGGNALWRTSKEKWG